MKSGVISLDDVRGSDVLASWFYKKYNTYATILREYNYLDCAQYYYIICTIRLHHFLRVGHKDS